jgi:hypothetical protein
MPPNPELFFPGADLSHLANIDGGSILGGKPKCLWHDTETTGLPSYSDGFFPNMTIFDGKPFQHIPANRAARALKNPAGGVQTNRWNVFQVEVCGFANKVTFVSVMRDVADWLHDVRGTPKTCTVEFKPFPGSGGPHNGVRLSNEAWSDYSGHLGHMHAPENDHGDPGSPFPIDLILARGDELSMADANEILKFLQDMKQDMVVFGTANLEKTVEAFAQRQRDALTKLDQLGHRLDDIERRLSTRR